MLKELSAKEALLLLAEKYPEPVEGWLYERGYQSDKVKGKLICVNLKKNTKFEYIAEVDNDNSQLLNNGELDEGLIEKMYWEFKDGNLKNIYSERDRFKFAMRSFTNTHLKKKMGSWFNCFAIEVPDEYRYMTRQEVTDWLCVTAYKNHQIRVKDDNVWRNCTGVDTVLDLSLYEYRAIQEIDGKIVYGEPMEFKIKVGE